LVTIFERNEHIILPHIWPTSYSSQDADGNPETQWFIGLIFPKAENLNVDLSYEIGSFTEQVKAQAMNLTMWKDGMELEAKYVRKKDLVKCLPLSVLGGGGKKKRKNTSAVMEGGKKARMNTTDEGSGSLLAESDVSMNSINSMNSFSTSQDSSTLLEDSITEGENGSPPAPAATAPPVRTGEVLSV